MVFFLGDCVLNCMMFTKADNDFQISINQVLFYEIKYFTIFTKAMSVTGKTLLLIVL